MCACIVALFHIGAALPRLGIASHFSSIPFFTHGWVFVDFFFVLSGFVIFANYEVRLREGFGVFRFMLLRFGRVYPLHFVLLVFAVLASVLAGRGMPSFFEVTANTMLIHSFGMCQYAGLNDASWSISTEFYAYLVFAFLVVGLKNRVTPVLVGVACLMALAVWSLRPFDDANHLTCGYGAVRCFYGFALGALVWKFFSRHSAGFRGGMMQSRWRHAAEAGVVVLVVLFVNYSDQAYLSVLFGSLLFSLTIFVFAFEGGCVSWLLKRRPFLIAGLLSYSIYMIHFLVAKYAFFGGLNLVKHVFGVSSANMAAGSMTGSAWYGDAIGIFYVATIIALSFVTWKLIESPGRRWFRDLAGRMP